MDKKPTIQDIARRAGVGPGTVSRVLNDHPNVSDKTRAKVTAIIEAMDYRPSFAARHMRTQKSHLIGFLSDEVATTPYAGNIILGAQEAAWQQERILLVVNTGHDEDMLDKVIETFLERDVEGIIYASMYHREVQLTDKIHSVPVVLANCFANDPQIPAIVPDEFDGGYRATQALLQRGHRRIGMINVNSLSPGIPASIGRWRGYRAALKEFGVKPDEQLERHGYGEAAHGYRFTFELMALSEPPTAIFCANDRTAMGAYNALAEMGKHIPHDVAVIGFDNQVIIAEGLRPPLTTMELPHYEMGLWAANKLLQLNDTNNIHQVLPKTLSCPLVMRKSI